MRIYLTLQTQYSVGYDRKVIGALTNKKLAQKIVDDYNEEYYIYY